MFDFFAEINFIPKTAEISENFFDNQPAYSKLTYTSHSLAHENSKFVWLSRYENPDCSFDNEKYIVLIYGYIFTRIKTNQETKRLTAEDIAKLFDENKDNIGDLIKGSYSLLIFEKAKTKVHLFTDHLNIKNIYYSYSNDKLLVSSSLSSFTHYSYKDYSSVNIKSVLEYYLFDFDLVGETFIKNVKTLAAASHLIADKDELQVSKYWDIFDQFADTEPIYDHKEGLQKVEKLMKQNLSLYLDKPEKTAFALTGGYDSRTNLALLNGKVNDSFFYSYGIAESFDIKLSTRIAKQLGLNFKAFYMDDKYAKNFDHDADIAVALGDGFSEMNRANYVYVYKNLVANYERILTGLFGSELIKRPTSLGGYIDRNVRDLLLTENFEETFKQIIEKAKEENYIHSEIIDEYKEQIYNDLLKNRYINNQYSGARKFFFFITGIGIRKYFMKEIKTERPFVENLHPYLDIEFIELLMKTPFPWVYNWETKKSLLENLKIHKFYGELIHRNNKKLSNIISTHAYKPKYLLKRKWLPLLILQYLFYKKKISKIGIFNNDEIIWEFYKKRKDIFDKYAGLFNQQNIENEHLKHMKDFTQLSSLQIWMSYNNLNI